MSVCGPGGQTEEDSGSEEVTTSGAAVREIYKQKPASKVVRVLTVAAYLLSVSLAAILLSVYYVWVWKSPELPPLNETAQRDAGALTASAHQAEDTHYFDQQHTFTGRSDSAIDSLEEVSTEGSNITSPGSGEMAPEGDSGNADSGDLDSGGNTTSLYDTTTVNYRETPAFSNDNDTGT